VIRDHKIIQLPDKDRDIFLAALDRTEARPLPGLMRAAQASCRLDRTRGKPLGFSPGY
jgi:hypothetical protein